MTDYYGNLLELPEELLSMTNSTGSASAAAAKLLGAARLAYLMRHRDADEAIQRGSKKKIVYAVDTSVLQLLIAPEKNKPRLFFASDETTSTALISALSHFIFYRLQKDPLIFIPPHDVEIISVINAIENKVGEKVGIELPFALETVAKNHEPAEIVMKVLLEKAPTVLGALFGIGERGPVRELERYHSLLRRNRIKSVASRSDFPTPKKNELPKIENRARDLYVSLKAVKSAPSRMRVMRDARVVAYIEWLNANISDRVVHLIAYDNALMSVVDAQAADAEKHFVRDPRYFLIANDLDQREPARNICDWIDGVLLGICPKGVNYHKWLGDVVLLKASVPELDSEKTIHSIEELSNRIGGYVNETGLEYGLAGSDVLDGDEERTVGDAAWRYLKANHEELANILRQRIGRTIREIDRLAVMAGFYLIADGDAEFSEVIKRLVDKEVRYFAVARAPAWLRFERLNDWTRQLHEALQSGPGNFRKIASAFDWPGSDTRKQYEFRLAYAYILSLLGHWDTAQNHCASAKKIADEYSDEISAYDASYFRAVCLRHLARNVEGVALAENELDDAEVRWSKAHLGEAVHDPRFKVEGIVQKFLKWQFRNSLILAGDAGASDVSKLELKGIIGGMWGLWPEVWSEYSDSIRKALTQQLFTNVAEATCIEFFILKTQTTIPLHELFDLLKSFRAQGLIDQDAVPLFVRLVLSLVEWLAAGDDVFRRGVARQEVRENISQYVPICLRRFEEGLFRSFLAAVELASETGQYPSSAAIRK